MAEIVQALPYPFSFNPLETVLLIIDMQRDFIESGGFGTALGNDVTPLQSIVPATLRLLTLARKTGMPVIHTRECHKPDLSDCPPAKLKKKLSRSS